MEYIVIKGEPVYYKDLTIEHIIAWCQENEQVPWLKVKVKEKRVRHTYPRKENGRQDKKAYPTGTRTTKISFMEVKYDFATRFCPEILPTKKPKKKSMLELVDEL